jgi:hypothetical protein
MPFDVDLMVPCMHNMVAAAAQQDHVCSPGCCCLFSALSLQHTAAMRAVTVAMKPCRFLLARHMHAACSKKPDLWVQACVMAVSDRQRDVTS